MNVLNERDKKKGEREKEIDIVLLDTIFGIVG